MGCTFQFFAEDLTQHRLIDRLRGLTNVKSQSLVDHCLIPISGAVSQRPKFLQDIDIDLNSDSCFSLLWDDSASLGIVEIIFLLHSEEQITKKG